MCDVTAFKANLEALEDYLEFVNTDVEHLMGYEVEMYAAYMCVAPGSRIHNIKDWYREAEINYISSTTLELYIMSKYDVYTEEDVDYWHEIEVGRSYVLECAGYWFHNN